MSTRRKNVLFYLSIVAIALLTSAIAIIRHEETSTGSSTAFDLASTVFLVFCTLGPSLLLKGVVAKLLPVEQLSKDARRLQRELRRLEKKRQHAIKKIDQLTLSGQWWEQERAILEATYLLEYRARGGAININPYLPRTS